MFNGGSRTSSNPLGDGSQKAESLANDSVDWLCDMLEALVLTQAVFTIENPARSLIFAHPRLASICLKYNLLFVYVDQCQYGLRSPEANSEGRFEIWKKPTFIVSNSAHFLSVERRCKHLHDHVRLKGHIRVGGRTHARTKLAGRYPVPLCRKLAACMFQAIHNEKFETEI